MLLQVQWASAKNKVQCAIPTMPGDACAVCAWECSCEGTTAILSPWEASIVAEGVPANWGAVQAPSSRHFCDDNLQKEPDVGVLLLQWRREPLGPMSDSMRWIAAGWIPAWLLLAASVLIFDTDAHNSCFPCSLKQLLLFTLPTTLLGSYFIVASA